MNWGQNAYTFIQDIVWWLALAITSVFAAKFITKKQFVQLVGFLVLAAVVLVIIDDPSRLKTIGLGLWNAIFK